jgi:hypothetical protein
MWGGLKATRHIASIFSLELLNCAGTNDKRSNPTLYEKYEITDVEKIRSIKSPLITLLGRDSCL